MVMDRIRSICCSGQSKPLKPHHTCVQYEHHEEKMDRNLGQAASQCEHTSLPFLHPAYIINNYMPHCMPEIDQP